MCLGVVVLAIALLVRLQASALQPMIDTNAWTKGTSNPCDASTADPGCPRSLKVYTSINKDWGKAFYRIHAAFEKFKPDWVTWVDDVDQADVHILHVLGAGERSQLVHPSTVIVQHVTRCDMSSEELVQLWGRAMLVASFHDLDRYVASNAPGQQHAIRTMTMPWGADPALFKFSGGKTHKAEGEDRYAMITGEMATTESHREVLHATAAVGMRLKHTGYQSSLAAYCDGSRPEACARFDHLDFQSEEGFQRLLREASWVPVLRKEEGFEMMGVEALFSGTRPIVYDTDTLTQPYRWFKGHAALLPEEAGSPGDDVVADSPTVKALVAVVAKPPPPITPEELRLLHHKFSWHSVVTAMYSRIWVELEHKRHNDPRPLPPQLAASLLPQGAWQEASRQLYLACMRADNTTLDWQAKAADPTTCPKVVIVLAAEDRTMDTCQDAALLGVQHEAHIAPPTALPPASTCTPAHLLLTPDAYPAHITPLLSPPTEIWLLEPAASHPSSAPILRAASILLRRTPPHIPAAWPAKSTAPPAAVQAPIPFMSIDPRPPASATLPAYSDFLLIVHPNSDPMAEAVIHYWAANPTFPPLHIAALPQSSTLSVLLSIYLAGAHPSARYNVTNIRPLPPSALLPAALPTLLSYGVHIHAVPPPTPAAPHPATLPHLANLARSAGAMLVLPSYAPSLCPFTSCHPSDNSLHTRTPKGTLPYGRAARGGGPKGVPRPLLADASAPAAPADARPPRGVGEAAEQLVDAVRQAVKMPLWSRMLSGQEGQRWYLRDAEAWRQAAAGLAARARARAGGRRKAQR